MPGFRKGKVPPPVVIQRIGREAVVDEAVRGQIGRWYLDALDAAGHPPGRRPEARHRRSARPRASRSLHDRDRRAPDGDARRRTRASRSPQARAGRRRRGGRGRDRRSCASARRAWRRSTREAGEGDFVVMDYLGTVDGEPFAGGEGRDQLIELGSGPARPRLRGAAQGREGRRGADADDHVPRRLRRRGARGQARPSSRSRSTRSSARSCPTLDDDFASDAAGFDTLDELREDIAGKLREADEAQGRGRVPRGRARRRRGRAGEGRGARGARRGPRPRAVGADAALALPPGHLARDVPADRGQRRGRDPRRGASPTPSRRCAARP